jgi:hypothetical protein
MPRSSDGNYVKSKMLTQKGADASRGRNFTAPQETKQWKCACGAANTARKDKCSYCGEPKPE